jgi:hypothetical protein
MRCLLLLAAALAACTGPGPGSQPEPAAPDLAAYVRDVHPIVEARCATLDCHGNFDRPLRLFAETGLRAGDELRDTPITAGELADNVEAVAALGSSGPVDDHLVLAKALGRMKHGGHAVWPDNQDVQLVCVRGWLAGESDVPAVRAACRTAGEQVALPPAEP